MRISERSFIAWLRKKPKPTRARATCDDGPVRTVVINARQGAAFWREAVDSLAALSPLRVELLNDAGDLIRAKDIEPELEEGQEEQEALEQQAALEERSSRSSSEDARLVQFARLLSEAYRNGAEAQRASSEVAFGRLIDLTNVAFQRLDALEKAYSRSFTERLREQAAGGAGKPDDLQAFLAAFLGGMAQGKPNGAPNGATTPAPPPEGATVV